MRPQHAWLAPIVLVLGAAGCSGNQNDGAAKGEVDGSGETASAQAQVSGEEPFQAAASAAPSESEKSLCGTVVYTVTESKAYNGVVNTLEPVGSYPRARHAYLSSGSNQPSIFECRFAGSKVTWRTAPEGTDQFSGWSDEIGGGYATFEVVGPATSITVTRPDGSTLVETITEYQE